MTNGASKLQLLHQLLRTPGCTSLKMDCAPIPRRVDSVGMTSRFPVDNLVHALLAFSVEANNVRSSSNTFSVEEVHNPALMF
jgi:hypothetical protein